jgi:putative ABC transport system permease protein
MIGHYIALALRNFRRRKASTAIKVVALAMGLACFVSAYLISDYFQSVDSGFAKSGRSVIVRTALQWPGAGTAVPFQLSTAGPFANALKAEVPQIEETLRISGGGDYPVRVGDTKSFRRVNFADPNFFDVFDFRFIKGDPASALTRPYSAVLSEAAAKALFGTTDAVGKTIRFSSLLDLTVTAVVAETPPPSTLGFSLISRPFDIIASNDAFDDLVQGDRGIRPSTDPNSWFVSYYRTIVVLPADGSFTAADLDRRLQGFGDRHMPKEQGSARFDTIPLTGVTTTIINTALLQGREGMSIIAVLYLFGGLILGISCLDFANLATAEAAGRAKEVGMRKVLGASRAQVLGQSLIEVMLLCLAATAIALIATAVVIGYLNQPNDLGFRFPPLGDFRFWGFLAGVIAATTIIGGLYPALVLAGVRPMLALRAGSVKSGSPLMRTALVGVQFAAASFLIIGVVVLYTQSRAVMRAGLERFDDPVVIVQTNMLVLRTDHDTIRNELLTDPSIKSVSGAERAPYSFAAYMLDHARSPDESAKTVGMHMLAVDYDYFATMKIKLLAGRVFSRDHADVMTGFRESKDRTTPRNYVLDATAIKALGFASPEEAVDKIIYERVPGIPEFGGQSYILPVRIIGVTEPEPFEITQAGTRDYSYFLMPQRANLAIIRIDRTKVEQALAHIDSVWNRHSPEVPIRRQFLDERFEQGYDIYNTINQVLVGLAAFAVVIAAMGLIGMATYTVGRRTHEIGVRKTLGATTGEILKLLLWEYSKPVLVANLIAWPLAYLAAQSYLAQFLTRASLTPVPFALSLIVTILIAWGAVANQAVRAARLKPASVLRYE